MAASHGVGPAAADAPRNRVTVDAAALGLGGFALSAFLLSVINTGLVDIAGEPIVFGVTLTYGGIAQLLADRWEFRTGNTFGGVVFSSYEPGAALAPAQPHRAGTFFVRAIGRAGAHSVLIKTGGWLGLCGAGGAWYLVLAHMVQAAFGRTVLPTGRLGPRTSVREREYDS